MSLEQEQRLSFNTPARWTNRFVGLRLRDPYSDRVRVAFAEGAPGEDKAYDFHSAIMMTVEDARALQKLLERIL